MNDIPDKVSPASARVSVQDADRYRAPASGRAEGMPCCVWQKEI